MSSLQRQLAAIAASSTQQLDIKAQKTAHGKSLLYNYKDAISQDFDTIFQICHEGFEDLCRIDPAYLPFSQTIFNEQSKSEDRTQMTAAQITELDSILENFLGLVGSRLMLRPAVKAVEWLVRRFQIHKYNTAWTILTFLPYHNEPIFLSLLSILPQKIPSALKFLNPYLTQEFFALNDNERRIQLDHSLQHTMVHAAAHNTQFFALLNGYTLKVSQSQSKSSALIPFWSAIVTQSIAMMLDESLSGRATVQEQRQEDVLLRILPVLQEGLSPESNSELLVGCYMMVAILVHKSSLSEAAMDSLMSTVAKTVRTETIEAAITTLSMIAEERPSIVLSDKVGDILLAFGNTLDILSHLSSRYRVSRLSCSLALRILQKIRSESGSNDADLHRLRQLAALLEWPEAEYLMHDLVKKVREAPSNDEAHHESNLSVELTQLVIESSRYETSLRRLAENLDSASFSKANGQENTRQTLENGADDGDVQMIDSSTSFEDQLADVINLRVTDSAFRTGLATDTFQATKTLFAIAKSDAERAKLAEIPFLLARVKSGVEPRFPEFCLQVLYENQASSTGTSAVLNSLSLIRTWLEQNSITVTSAQNIFPAICLSLTHFAVSCRRVAASVFKLLLKLFKEQSAGKDVKPPSSVFLKVIKKVIVPSLEECILDKNRLIFILRAALRGKSQEASSDKKAALDLNKHVRSAVRDAFAIKFAAPETILPAKMFYAIILRDRTKVDSSALNDLRKGLKAWTDLSVEDAETECVRYDLAKGKIDQMLLSVTTAKDPSSIELLFATGNGDVGQGRETTQQAAWERMSEIWSGIPLTEQTKIGEKTLALALSHTEAPSAILARASAANLLKAVVLPPSILSQFLQESLQTTQMPDGPPSSKRRRTSRESRSRPSIGSVSSTDDTLRQATFVLELVDESSQTTQMELLKDLFQVLSRIQLFKNTIKADLSYLHILTLRSLLTGVKEAEVQSRNLDELDIRADLLVDCIRNASNPQISTEAVLIMASLARQIPERVLHSVMPIFTFMGGNLSRQADENSAYVVDHTISQVIPPMMQSLEQEKKDKLTGIAPILLSFVTAYEHMPTNRRQRVFTHLIHIIGAEESLFAAIAMLVDRYSVDDQLKAFVQQVAGDFDEKQQTQAALQCVDIFLDALQPERRSSEILLSFDGKTAEQRGSSLQSLLRAVYMILGQPRLQRRVRHTFSEEAGRASDLRMTFSELLKKALILSRKLEEGSKLKIASTAVNSVILGLLPLVEFTNTATDLLANADDDLTQSILVSFEQEIAVAKKHDANAANIVLDFLPRLADLIQKSRSSKVVKATLECISQAMTRFGRKDTESILAIGWIIVGEHTLLHKDPMVRDQAIVALTAGLRVLREQAMPLGPKLLEGAAEHLQQLGDAGYDLEDEEAEMAIHSSHVAVWTLFLEMARLVPVSLVGGGLDKVLKLGYAYPSPGHPRAEAYLDFLHNVSAYVPAKETFSALNQVWSDAFEHGHEALENHLTVLGAAIDASNAATIRDNALPLLEIFLQGFSLESRLQDLSSSSPFSLQGVLERMQEEYGNVAVRMIEKMNDTSFRPLFVRMAEWATTEQASDNNRDNNNDNDTFLRDARAAGFYTFLVRFFSKLKSIVTGYASYILDDAAVILARPPPSFGLVTTLPTNVLLAITLNFDNDESDFWQTPAHFEKIAPALVTCLELRALHQESHPDTSSTTPVTNALAALATALSSANLQRDLATRLLALLRHRNPRVRQAACHAQTAITEACRDEWTAHLPEMLPFISEVQDDGDEEVEQAANDWIKSIEAVLGQGLAEMLE